MRTVIRVMMTLVVAGGGLAWLDARSATSSAGLDVLGKTRLVQAQWPQPGSRGDVVPLWPEGVPGQIKNGGPESFVDGRISNVHEPTLTVFRAPAASAARTAIIVCPGGGYTRLAIEKEGRATAEWLNGIGVSAFVLRYRLKEYGHPAPLRDVLRAVRLVRLRAAEWGVAPDRIGVLGFSAGGHVAASAGTLFDDPDGRTTSPLDVTSARPDFLILVYPVIRLTGINAHSGSADALLGASATVDVRERYSLDSRVTARTPPAFLVHGGTDTSVSPENSVLFYEALRRAGVPAELHLFESGPHGVGLQPGFGAISDWPRRCTEWLSGRGLLTAPGR